MKATRGMWLLKFQFITLKTQVLGYPAHILCVAMWGYCAAQSKHRSLYDSRHVCPTLLLYSLRVQKRLSRAALISQNSEVPGY